MAKKTKRYVDPIIIRCYAQDVREILQMMASDRDVEVLLAKEHEDAKKLWKRRRKKNPVGLSTRRALIRATALMFLWIMLTEQRRVQAKRQAVRTGHVRA